MPEDNVYTELMGFLKSDRTDLRLAATEAVLAVTDREGMANLIQHGAASNLSKLTSIPDKAGMNALIALVHLSSHGPSASRCVEDLIDCNAIGRMVEIGLSSPHDDDNNNNDATKKLENWNNRIHHAMALLANMTRAERGAVEFLGKSLPEEAIPSQLHNSTATTTKTTVVVEQPPKPTLSLLLARFLSEEYIIQKEKDGTMMMVSDKVESKEHSDIVGKNTNTDPYQHFAAVLMNSTQIESGRKFVMRIRRDGADDKKNDTTTSSSSSSSSSSVLQSILPQLRSTNPIRRRGIAGVIKNCCFDSNSAWWLINEMKIVKHLLYPLAGPEELDIDDRKGLDPDLWLEGPDKVRETDQTTRLWLVESILLLCASGRQSRESLRLQRTYVILKMADMVEESEEVSERINECVQFLRRDEEGTVEGSSDQMVEKVLKIGSSSDDGKGGRRLALPAPSASKEVGGDDEADYDDVD